MRVVEIGCGEFPGPRFDGADEYYVLDVDKTLVDKAAGYVDDVLPIVGSADKVPLEDGSVDFIVARNVFSDPYLAINGLGRTDIGMMQLTLLMQGARDKFVEMGNGIANATDSLKDSILREAGRLLVVGGKLVTVDSNTPQVSDRYFAAREAEGADNYGLLIQSAELSEAVPANYAADHAWEHPTVRIATKL